MGQPWHHRLLAGKTRLPTLIVLAVTAVLMLSGLGKTIISVSDSFAKSDRLAAISLLLTGTPRDALPVTFLDVDDATRTAWGATGVTPHAALASLIGIAAEGGARGILLDFDLAMDQPGTPADPAMAGFLRTYPPEAPLLMLVRRINAGTAEALGTPYDAEAASKSNIRWVTTLTDASSDRMVRRVRLWETVCDGSAGVAFPSVPLLTAAALLDSGRNLAAMDAFLENQQRVICGHADAEAAAWPPVQSRLVRVPFVLAHHPDAKARLRIETNGTSTFALWRIPASRLVGYADGAASPVGDIDRSPFEGRMSVIGGSYSDSGDLYATPLGVMPGAMVLANSIVQARAMVETVPASPLTRSLFAVCLLVAFAAIVRFLVPLVALVSIAAVSVLALMLLSRLFGFETGIEALASGLTGFGLFKLADMIINLILDIPRRGLKAVLKP